jgi:hypothetical protein
MMLPSLKLDSLTITSWNQQDLEIKNFPPLRNLRSGRIAVDCKFLPLTLEHLSSFNLQNGYALTRLTNLISLSTTDIVDITQCLQLQELDMYWDSVFEGDLSAFTKLTKLEVNHESLLFTQVFSLCNISNLENLKYLHAKNPVDFELIGKCTNIRHLSLCGRIPDDVDLKNLQHVEFLKLDQPHSQLLSLPISSLDYEASLSESLLSFSLRQTLTKLVVLKLENAKALEDILACTKLRELEITYELTNEQIESLSSLPNLKKFKKSQNKYKPFSV